MSRAVWALSLLAALLAGVALGLGVAHFAHRHAAWAGFRQGPPPRWGALRERGEPAPRWRAGRPLAAWLARRLDLEPAQRETLAAVLVRHRARLEAERHGFAERMAPLHDSLMDEIRAMLTPAQRERLDRLARRLHARTDRFERGRGAPD